jgi:hypothetical protein
MQKIYYKTIKRKIFLLKLKIKSFLYKKYTFFDVYKNTKFINEYINDYPEKLPNEDTFFNINNLKLSSRYSFAINYIKKIKKKKINILEIGGGANPQHFYIKKFTKKNIISSIVETKYFCTKIKKKLPTFLKKEINYYNNINKIDFKDIDIAIFTSSIQYIFNYRKILKKIMQGKIKRIIIAYSYFTDFKEDIYVIQNNLEVPVVNCWISKTSIIEFLKSEKYQKIKFFPLKEITHRHKSVNSNNFCAYNVVINAR